MIVLASRSASRRAMLDAAGVAYRCVPADLDERAVEHALGDVPPGAVALALARAKAMSVCANAPGSVVLGSDSVAMCGGRRFDKPASRADAATHLRHFSGRLLELHSAAALVRDGAEIWSHATMATLHVRKLSDAFIETYLDAEWPQVSGCVGVFRIEGPGVQLFDRIDGDYFTILGMPLLDVLAALRGCGALPE